MKVDIPVGLQLLSWRTIQGSCSGV